MTTSYQARNERPSSLTTFRLRIPKALSIRFKSAEYASNFIRDSLLILNSGRVHPFYILNFID